MRVVFFPFTTVHVCSNVGTRWKYLMFIRILGYFSPPTPSGQFVSHVALWGGLGHVS